MFNQTGGVGMAEVNWAEIYRERRNRIRDAVGDEILRWLGHDPQPRNYRDNTYPFRQNSHFLYYTGLSSPYLAVISYPEKDSDVLFAPPAHIDDIVWMGAGRTRVDLAKAAGIDTVEDIGRLGVYLTRAGGQGQRIHYLPPYQASSLFRLTELLVIDPTDVSPSASEDLMQSVTRQRSIKTDLEIEEIENALCITKQMHCAAMAAARPGAHKHEIAGTIQGIAL